MDPKTASEFAYIMSDKNADLVNSGKPVSELGIKALDKYKLQVELENLCLI